LAFSKDRENNGGRINTSRTYGSGINSIILIPRVDEPGICDIDSVLSAREDVTNWIAAADEVVVRGPYCDQQNRENVEGAEKEHRKGALSKGCRNGEEMFKGVPFQNMPIVISHYEFLRTICPARSESLREFDWKWRTFRGVTQGFQFKL
jgi:hypothetical protein